MKTGICNTWCSEKFSKKQNRGRDKIKLSCFFKKKIRYNDQGEWDAHGFNAFGIKTLQCLPKQMYDNFVIGVNRFKRRVGGLGGETNGLGCGSGEAHARKKSGNGGFIIICLIIGGGLVFGWMKMNEKDKTNSSDDVAENEGEKEPKKTATDSPNGEKPKPTTKPEVGEGSPMTAAVPDTGGDGDAGGDAGPCRHIIPAVGLGCCRGLDLGAGKPVIRQFSNVLRSRGWLDRHL